MKYLITGGHGKLGTELRPLIEGVAPSHTEMDILQRDQVDSWMQRSDIDAVLHLAALASRADAEKNKPLAYQLNVIGTRIVAEAAARYGKKMIYLSTDMIFSGTEGGYRETDPASPRDWYASTKYAGELEVQHATGNYLLIRTTFRPNAWEFPTAYTNVYTTGDYVDVIAKELALCLELNPSGVIHVGTPKKTSFELAKRRRPDIIGELFPDPTFLRRDLNIEKWEALKKNYE